MLDMKAIPARPRTHPFDFDTRDDDTTSERETVASR